MKTNLIKSSERIYQLLYAKLETATQPMTCADLMDSPEIRTVALERWGDDVPGAVAKLSDHLGFMWRRGVLDRFNAPPSLSKARYAYALKNRFSEQDAAQAYVPKEQTKNRGDLEIIEKDGEVVLTLEKFVIVIRPR